MAGYPYFPQYQPYYPQPLQDPMQMRQQVQNVPSGPVDDRIWVTGEAGAQSYLVAANGFVRLWDSSAPVFYEKQADASGRPLPLAVYEYKRRGGEPEPVTAPDYSIEIEAINKRIDAIEKKFTANAKKKSATEREVEQDD